MRVSKHVHSCLLVEEQNETILIDPGNFTYEEKALSLSTITKLNYLLITHGHQDHMYIPFIKEICQKFPNIDIISNEEVAAELGNEGITVQTHAMDNIYFQDAVHEKILSGDVPKNIVFNIFDKLTHPGDSFHFEAHTPVLAMPMQAPWGSMMQAVEKAITINPRVIIPIHDWHWNDKARESFYMMLKDYFSARGIDFKPLKTGEVVEV